MMQSTIRNKSENILVINNSVDLSKVISTLVLGSENKVIQSESLSKALEIIAIERIHLILISTDFADRNISESIKRLRLRGPFTEIILISDNSNNELTQLKYLELVSSNTKTDILVQKIKQKTSISKMNEELAAHKTNIAMTCGLDNIVGESQSSIDLREKISKISNTEIPVLITGDTGTGKTQIAKTIHHHSDKKSKPFVIIDCSNSSLLELESSLFNDHIGQNTNSAGTIYFKEINSLPMHLQPTLADALNRNDSSSGVTRFKYDLTDSRVVSSTTENLQKLVASGQFDSTLYNSINLMPIETLSLSDRTEDIETISLYFLRHFSPEKQIFLSPEALEILLAHNWTRNLSELKETLESSALSCKNQTIETTDLQNLLSINSSVITRTTSNVNRIETTTTTTPEIETNITRKASLADNQKDLIVKVLDDNNWNYTQTAEELGIGRTTLWRKIKKFNLKKEMSEE